VGTGEALDARWFTSFRISGFSPNVVFVTSFGHGVGSPTAVLLALHLILVPATDVCCMPQKMDSAAVRRVKFKVVLVQYRGVVTSRLT
jgi:hypothetical protein